MVKSWAMSSRMVTSSSRSVHTPLAVSLGWGGGEGGEGVLFQPSPQAFAHKIKHIPVPRPLQSLPRTHFSIHVPHYLEYTWLVGVVRLTLSVGEVAGADGAVVGVAALEGAYHKGHMMWV